MRGRQWTPPPYAPDEPGRPTCPLLCQLNLPSWTHTHIQILYRVTKDNIAPSYLMTLAFWHWFLFHNEGALVLKQMGLVFFFSCSTRGPPGELIHEPSYGSYGVVLLGQICPSFNGTLMESISTQNTPQPPPPSTCRSSWRGTLPVIRVFPTGPLTPLTSCTTQGLLLYSSYVSGTLLQLGCILSHTPPLWSWWTMTLTEYSDEAVRVICSHHWLQSCVGYFSSFIY